VKRGGPLRRTPLKRGTSQLRRSPLKPMSEKRRDAIPDRAQVRSQVFARDGYRCQAASLFLDVRCFGNLTVHHLTKASQGGTYTPDNLVTLCARHNDLIEERPTIATALGLVRRPHG